jgi:isoleucyl-tRNA synthetase
MVERGSRPVFWSFKQQRILSEGDFVQKPVIKDALLTKLSIRNFGSKAEKIMRNYPDAKVVVFTDDAWQICGAQAVAFNPKLFYTLTKLGDEHLILAEKRLGEFSLRAASRSKERLKTLLVFSGEVFDEIKLEKPFEQAGELVMVPKEDLAPTFGTGLSTVAPAHNIDSLRLSYTHNLSREGVVCHKTGALNSPHMMQDIKLNDPNLN